MSARKDFEEYCKRTRPTLHTEREIKVVGLGDYVNRDARSAWKVWQYLDKQNNPRPAKGIFS